MDNQEALSSDVLAELTTDIVAAFVGNNAVQASELPSLIASVHSALGSLGKPVVEAVPDTKLSSAEIRKSIKPDSLISFLDGRPYKTLKRHLSKSGMTPDEYRAKYGLPHDYPMVAQSYSEQRSSLAKSLGLGQVRKRALAEKKADVSETVAEEAAPKRRGRPSKKAA